jgi:hypothetical protein
MAKLSHAGPEQASAADAWRRIEDFFAEHLGQGPLGACGNWANPVTRRFTQVATYVERQQRELTQFSDSTQLVMSFRRKYQNANQTATMAYPSDHKAPVIMSERSTVGARASRQAYA